MIDAIRRFIIEGLDIRGAVVHLGRSWQEMQATRNYGAPERDLLGELAAVALMMEFSSAIKRPVVETAGGQLLVGFDPALFESFVK